MFKRSFVRSAVVLGAKRNNLTARFKYHAAHKESLTDHHGFWDTAAKDIDWIKEYDHVSQSSHHDKKHNQWFVGGKLNTAYNCVDRHVRDGLGDKVAIIYDSPVTDTIKKLTYNDLQVEVIKAASVLTGLGVQKGYYLQHF
jgi:propionyl-CoA synthetase